MNSTFTGNNSFLGDYLMTEDQVAKELGTNIFWLRRARKEGRGPKFIRLGRFIRYPENEVKLWISRLLPAGDAT